MALKFQSNGRWFAGLRNRIKWTKLKFPFFITTRSTGTFALIAQRHNVFQIVRLEWPQIEAKENASIEMSIDRIIGFVNKFNPTIVHNVCLLATGIIWYQNCDIHKWANHIIAQILPLFGRPNTNSVERFVHELCVIKLTQIEIESWLKCHDRIHRQPKLVSFLPFQFSLQINWQHKNTAAFKI